MAPLAVNVIVAAAVVTYFLIEGITTSREINSEDDYFLSGRRLGSDEYANSFAAASTSLATVLFFFVTLGVTFGIYILFAPLTYLLGCYIYKSWILPKLDAQGFFQSSGNAEREGKTVLNTLGAYIQERYANRYVTLSIVIVTFIGLVSILLIELYVGVTIFSIYLKPEFNDLALVLISCVVFIYTGFGGLRAVIKTDKTQLVLMFAAVICFVVWLVYSSYAGGAPIAASDFFVKPPPVSVGVLLPYSLLFNVLIVNLFLPYALLRTWQMAAASPKATNVAVGIWRGVWLTTLLTGGFIIIGILFFKSVFPGTTMELQAMLTTLADSGGGIGAYVIFPLFFAASLAALLSTADSALIPISQSIFQDFAPKRQVEWKRQFYRILVVTFIILVVVICVYFVVFRILNFDLISWLFTIFSLLIIATPSIVFAAIAPPEVTQSKAGRTAALLSIWGGLLVAIGISLIGKAAGRLDIVQLNSPIAALVGSLPFVGVWFFRSKARAR